MNLFDSGIQDNWRHRVPGNAFKHGMHKTPTYNAWCEMKRRCLDPGRQNYYLYGGRGIKVCSAWLEGFDNFLQDMGVKPEGYSLERVDVNGNYEPGNCKWIPLFDQGSNKRNNSWIEVDGLKLTQAQWARKLGVPDSRLYDWNKRGVAVRKIKELYDV